MKKIILILALIITTQLETKAQQETQFIAATQHTFLNPAALPGNNTFLKSMYSSGNNVPVKDHAYYMNKRKMNLTAGLATLGGGILFSGIGLLVASGSNYDETGIGGGVITGIGAIAGFVSIPFMIMAEVYKHKAKVQLSKEKTGFGTPSKVGKSITGITIAIPIGK